MKNCAFTIVAKNYIGLAQILEKLIREYYNDLLFYIIVADEIDNELKKELSTNILVAKETLNITPETWENMSFKYNLTEFCTSIKPASFRYLLDNTESEKIIYLDPDIYFYNSIGLIFDMLSDCDILLTPHITQITEFVESDSPENVWLSCGMFNLGFCGISRSITADKMLAWWHNRLIDNCYIDGYDSLFTDQKWMDFLPSFFTSKELHVTHHLGMNVAPWNFFERKIIKESTQFTVVSRLNQGKSYPLLFVHYSGYNYVELLRGNIVQNNILGLKNYPDIMHLVLTYAEAIKAQNAIFNRFINQLYTYNFFDNGDALQLVHRRIYRSLIKHGYEIKHPYSIKEGTFYHLLYKHRMINKSKVNVDKLTKRNLKGIKRKLYIFNWLSDVFYNLIGYERYMVLIRLLRPFSRYEAQIHLLDKKYFSNNIY